MMMMMMMMIAIIFKPDIITFVVSEFSLLVFEGMVYTYGVQIQAENCTLYVITLLGCYTA
jgi:hypothetical protein